MMTYPGLKFDAGGGGGAGGQMTQWLPTHMLGYLAPMTPAAKFACSGHGSEGDLCIRICTKRSLTLTLI
jgi:hypothetical protein